MAEVNMKKAKEVYAKLVAMLEKHGWSFDRHDDDLVISSGVKGDDLPIEFIVVVNAKQQVAEFLSRLPFEMPAEKRVEGAVAVCAANDGICDGSFDYNIRNGQITFRLTTSFCGGTVLGEELFEYMIFEASATVDKYNDKFYLLAQGGMSLSQFIEFADE